MINASIARKVGPAKYATENCRKKMRLISINSITENEQTAAETTTGGEDADIFTFTIN